MRRRKGYDGEQVYINIYIDYGLQTIKHLQYNQPLPLLKMCVGYNHDRGAKRYKLLI